MADGDRVVAPGGQGAQGQAATSLELWQQSLRSQAGGPVLFLSACELGTDLREGHEGLTSGKGGQPQAGGTECRETRDQRAGALGSLPAPLGVSCWHVSRGSRGKPGCRTPLCPHCTWPHHFLQIFLTNTDITDRSGKGGAWTWRHRPGSGAEEQQCAAIIAGDNSRDSVVLPSPSSASLQAPLTPSPPQMSLPKATFQKLGGTRPWKLFLAVFSNC